MTAKPSPSAPRAAGSRVVALLALVLLPAAAAGEEPPTLLVLGMVCEDSRPEIRDLRLGMGVRGGLVRIFAERGVFRLVEEKALAPTVREAVDGYWLRERSPEELADLDRLHRETGADWIARGHLKPLRWARDSFSGPVGGGRWAYRAELRLCLHGRNGAELCRQGRGKSSSAVVTWMIEYRGDDVVFDQAGPAEAVDRALDEAFRRLLAAWEARR